MSAVAHLLKPVFECKCVIIFIPVARNSTENFLKIHFIHVLIGDRVVYIAGLQPMISFDNHVGLNNKSDFYTRNVKLTKQKVHTNTRLLFEHPVKVNFEWNIIIRHTNLQNIGVNIGFISSFCCLKGTWAVGTIKKSYIIYIIRKNKTGNKTCFNINQLTVTFVYWTFPAFFASHQTL